MDVGRHLHYCPPGSPFFDLPATAHTDEDDFPLAHEEPPPGWTRSGGTEWIGISPPDSAIPGQGWKIHVSATPDNAEDILATVWKYCLAGAITFKFLRSRAVLESRNSKYGDRSASGKFVTIYPLDEARLALILSELDDLLGGREGPYILSDLRYRSGPLYVRYGGFLLRTVRADTGELVHCVEDPEGRLVPDHRGPGFRPPAWAPLPDCLAESAAARNSGTLEDFPYRVTSAVHFSNGGGVYRGTDTRDGADVLLREARPFAGLVDGEDAVGRQQREHWALERLAGLDCIPRLIDFRKGREHYFLVREYAEGEPLAKEMIRRNPLAGENRSPEAFTAYTEWALRILGLVEEGIASLHARGVVFRDLHPSNILVRPDDTVVFIDFETADSVDSPARQTMGAPGFTAPAEYRGPAIDRYALGCLRLAVFIPLPTLLLWGPEKTEDLIDAVLTHFPVPADFADTVRRDLGIEADTTCPRPTADLRPDPRENWPALRTEIIDGILATATPDRQDRLFPGDPEQFATSEGGAAFAYGAAGVLWSLAEAGASVPAHLTDWLVAATHALDRPSPGFCTGLSGIALALDRLGRAETARALVSQVVADLGTESGSADDTLLSGASGVGLTLLHFARSTGEGALLDEAVRLAERITAGPAGSPDGRTRFGLLRGPAGRALFLLRLYEATGAPSFLEHAHTALRQELTHLGWKGDHLPESAPGRAPLLAVGSAGTGMVLHDFVTHRPEAELIRARDAILGSARRRFVAQTGLFHGRAGTLVALRHMVDGTGAQKNGAEEESLRLHVDGFALQTVRLDDRPAFLGHEAMRVSTDLATGGAGVLLALNSALTDGGPSLPFFRRSGLAPRTGAAS
ncbi:class III lanthionine synthetase LanKC [Streptomyces sp. F8]|uniref:class III lanthionine synthetase LanKC n=1 Tax=Streptomyces sp. F8 TaxID=1436085 RepID=UPI0029D22D5B|nr:class III lanthionine synthetase LanKC [Streptomyces sp. F8]MDX6758068.1 class III lanthionine synthetase LanKC [Streptomyces sp. F8]